MPWGAIGQTIPRTQVDNAGQSVSNTFAVTPAAGCLILVAGWSWQSGGGPLLGADINSVVDNQGNAYTLIKSALAGQERSFIAFCPNVQASGPFTITINMPLSANYITWGAIEVPEAALANVLDQQ